jgi:hypothetical protein
MKSIKCNKKLNRLTVHLWRRLLLSSPHSSLCPPSLLLSPAFSLVLLHSTPRIFRFTLIPGPVLQLCRAVAPLCGRGRRLLASFLFPCLRLAGSC